MQNIQIKNSIKKLVIENLCRLHGDTILFVGSLCDFVYIDFPLEEVKDIDIKIPLSQRSSFLSNVLTKEFHIYNQSGRRFVVKPYRTYEPIRNFGIHRTTYYSENVQSFLFSYHFHILGIVLDISFYYDDNVILPKNQVDKNFCIQTIANRKKLLEEFSKRKNFPTLTQEKHLFKIPLYNELKTNSTLTNPLDKINTYVLPNEFNPIVYKQKNIHDLYRLTNKDSLIDHYVAHGTFENRII